MAFPEWKQAVMSAIYVKKSHLPTKVTTETFRTILKLKDEIITNYKAIVISVFGFSTLYENVPHHKLKSVMVELIKFCFSGGVKEFIGIAQYGVIWTNNQ